MSEKPYAKFAFRMGRRATNKSGLQKSSGPRLPVVLVVAAIASALFLAACGGTSNSSSSSGSPASGGSTEAATKPEGKPIKVMTISVTTSEVISLPQVFAAAQAAAAEINANGGVKGQPIEVVECSTEFDPNKEAACTKQAVSEEVTAVVGSYLFFPGGLKQLEEAKIPYFAGAGSLPEEQTSPISFSIPVQGSEHYGLANMLVENGSEKNVAIANEAAATQAIVEGVDEGLGWASYEPLEVVEAPPAQADYSAAVASALSKHPTTVSIFESPNDTAKVIKALRQADYQGKIATVAVALSPEAIEALGSAGAGVEVASGLIPLAETGVSAVEEFKEAMKTYKSSSTVDSFSELTYAAMILFGKVADTVQGEVDAKSFSAAASASSSPIDVELIPPWVGKGTPTIKQYPRSFIYGYVPTEIKGEELVRVGSGPFIEPIEVLKEKGN